MNLCEKCGGSCCSFDTFCISYSYLLRSNVAKKGLRFELNRVLNFQELITGDGNIVDFEWIFGIDPDNESHVLAFSCNFQEESGKCGIYDDRPKMCRAFECPALEGKMSLEEMSKKYMEETIDKVADVTYTVNKILKNQRYRMKTERALPA